jgi:hypothetical protein
LHRLINPEKKPLCVDENFDSEEKKPPEMTLWGPEGGKMPESDQLLTRSAPFWFTGLFTDPRAVYRHEMDEGNLGQALTRVIAVALAIGFIALMPILFFSLLGTGSASEAPGGSQEIGYTAILYRLMLYPVASVLFFLLWNALLFGFGKLLGGSGGFGKQASLLSVLSLWSFALAILYFLVSIVVTVISVVLIFPLFIWLPLSFVAQILLFFYFLYLNALAISVAHKMDILRSGIALIFAIALVVAVYVGYIFLIVAKSVSAI